MNTVTTVVEINTNDAAQVEGVVAPGKLIETTDLAQVGGGWAAGVW